MMHRKHWMRHTALAPKGFLRYEVLESLSEKPMSGSEIISEVEKKTDGRWRPSPGSIYPLLAWLQDDGYIKEMPSQDNGMKRYSLTDKGKGLLEEERKIKEKLGKEARFFGPPFMGPLWFRMPPEMAIKARASVRRFMSALFDLGSSLDKAFSKEVVEAKLKVLDEAAEKLEAINKKLKGEHDE